MLALTGGIATVGLGGIVSGAMGQDESGDDAHDHDHDHELGRPEPYAEVAMRTDEDGHHFVPHVVHVEPGGTVTWTLESGVHDVVAYHPENAALLPSAAVQRVPEDARPWASDVYATEGATFELTFEREGIYDYTCTVGGGHGHGGRHGHGGHHGPDGRHGPTDVNRPEDGGEYDERRRSENRRDGDDWGRSDGQGEYDGWRRPDDRDGRRPGGPRGTGDGHCHGRAQGATNASSAGQYRTHEAAGMVGRVVVGWPELDPEREPALRSPSEDLPDAARRELASFDERTRTALEDGERR